MCLNDGDKDMLRGGLNTLTFVSVLSKISEGHITPGLHTWLNIHGLFYYNSCKLQQ